MTVRPDESYMCGSRPFESDGPFYRGDRLGSPVGFSRLAGGNPANEPIDGVFVDIQKDRKKRPGGYIRKRRPRGAELLPVIVFYANTTNFQITTAMIPGWSERIRLISEKTNLK